MNFQNNQHHLRIVPIALLIVGIAFVKLPCTLLAATEPARTELINMPVGADLVKILPGSNQLLLISNKEQQINLFDLDTKTIKGSARLDYNVTDAVIDISGRYAYLIGGDTKGKSGGYISRVDTTNDQVRTITLSERLVLPTIAIDASNNLFIGDQVSSVVRMVGAESFDASGSAFLPADTERIVFLKRGPPAAIGVTGDGKFLFVSHIGTPAISMVNVKNRETLFVYDLPSTETKSGGIRPYSLLVVNGLPSKEGSLTSVLLGTDQDDSLLVLDLDPRFGNLDVVQVVKLGLRAATYSLPEEERYGKPPRLLIGSDTDQHAIVLGNRGSRRVVVLGRQGRIIERKNSIDLPAEALCLDVSRGGDFAVVVDNKRSTLTVIRRSAGWASPAAPTLGSEDLRTAQSLLSIQGFAIGAVDGVYGPQTRRAIALFQEKAGLKLTGILDPPTLLALHEQAILVYRAKLKNSDRESNPIFWAAIQRSLGTSLLALGEKDTKTTLVEQAVAALSAAAEVFEKQGASVAAHQTRQDLARAQTLLQGRQSAEKISR